MGPIVYTYPKAFNIFDKQKIFLDKEEKLALT
jgi:hypothetical protein